MTERIAVHTRLRAGSEADYERIHTTIPEPLAERMRAAGVENWTIWRDGQDLFHLIEVDDYRAMRRALADDPVNAEWQDVINPLLEAPDDYSGGDDGLGRVWSLA